MSKDKTIIAPTDKVMMIITRHLEPLRPVPSLVMDATGMTDTQIRMILQGHRETVTRGYPEFASAKWYADKVPSSDFVSTSEPHGDLS